MSDNRVEGMEDATGWYIVAVLGVTGWGLVTYLLGFIS